jgi:hypothetical protein
MTVPPSCKAAVRAAPTFCVLHPRLFLETVDALHSRPHVVADPVVDVVAASAVVLVSVAGPAAVFAALVFEVAVSEAELAVFAGLFSVSLLSAVPVFVFAAAVCPSRIPADIFVDSEVAVSVVVEPAIFAVSEPVVSVAVASADVAEPQVSVDIGLAFAVLIPVSVVAAWADNPGRPIFYSFPNIDYSASPSSSVVVADEESAHNSIGARSNYGPCNALSNLALRHNKSLEHDYNRPTHGYNNASDTNDPAMAATTNHSRKTGLPLYWERRRHYWYRAIRPRAAVLRIR